MIGQLRGIVLEKQPPIVLLDVHGVGYEVHMPMTCFYDLPEAGQEVTVQTHFVVREDAQQLFGFNHRQERALFRELIKVNGVGPKLALAILSGMSAAQFLLAIEQEAVASLVKLPGVGKKTAERLVVEMKDRLRNIYPELLGEQAPQAASAPSADLLRAQDAEGEAVAALIALGYKPQEASRMISKVKQTGADSETLIRDALRAAL